MSSDLFQHTRAIKAQTDAIIRLAKAIEHQNELTIEIHRSATAPTYADVPRKMKDD